MLDILARVRRKPPVQAVVRQRAFALALACLAALFPHRIDAQPADLVVENARIYTGVPGAKPAAALVVRSGRVIYVGDDVSKFIASGTTRLNAQGATVVPGFIDSHGHIAGLGDMLESLNLRGMSSIESVAAAVKKAAAGKAKGEWIRGRAWDQTNWGGAFPTAQSLTEAAPDHPVYLARVDGHAAWVNRKALDLADVNKATADPPGGKIVRDANGVPTGVLIDRAMGLVSSKIPARTPEETERALARAAQECARLGLTTVHDAGVGAAELRAYRKLIAEDRLPVRVYAMIGGAGPLWREYLDKGPDVSERLTVRSIKLMSDGAMGSRGAAFLEPYSDDPGNRGLLILSKEEIERVARDAVKRGFQVNTHAIGDRANRTVLEAYAAVLGGKNDKRFRIEHAQVIAPADFDKFAANSVIASIQSTHATSDMRWAEARIGKERLGGAWPAKRFLQLGIPVANGSDFPVEDANPLWGFYAAVTRQDHNGEPPHGFLPGQKLTREEALRSWTAGGAYAAFEEQQKGTLEPGKLADFVLLTRDIMTVLPPEILNTRVKATVLGGRVVYRME
jgi:predicted amidohydrolase YtcJ